MSILIGIFTFVLIIISVFLVLLVLAQKAKNDGGMGAALGGGMAEATFGADTGNVLTRSTIFASVAFFVLSFLLYLGHIHQTSQSASGTRLPTIEAPAEETLPVLPATDSVLPDFNPDVIETAPLSLPTETTAP